VAVAGIADTPPGNDFVTLGIVRGGQWFGLAKRVAFGAVMVFQTAAHTGVGSRRSGVTLVAGDTDPFLVVGALAAPTRIDSTVSAHATQTQMFALTSFAKFTTKNSFCIFTNTFATHPDRIMLARDNNIVNGDHKVINGHGKQTNQGRRKQHAKTIDRQFLSRSTRHFIIIPPWFILIFYTYMIIIYCVSK
jgi:hypothetical protein